MENLVDLSEAKVYVGTYHKYNCGSLFGKWLVLSDYSDIDDFYEACEELHNDEDDPEFMFQDYENIPDALIGECWISQHFFSFRDAIESLSEDELTAFYIWCDNGHRDIDNKEADELVNEFQEDYVGQYRNEEEFAEEYLEMNNNDLSEFAKQYFDYEAYARDLFATDFWMEGEFVFRNY